jgi:hypothetical protein
MAMMHPPQPPQGSYHHPQTLEEVRTLWIGDLQYWVDENYLTSCFSQTGEVSLHLFVSSAFSKSCDFVNFQFTALHFPGFIRHLGTR